MPDSVRVLMNVGLPVYLLFVFGDISAYAADVAGSKDHPVVSRYAGSDILKYEAKDFDRYTLSLGASRDKRRGPGEINAIEGRITRLNYRAPAGRTSLEVFRNYEQSLRGAGFNILFQCMDAQCGNDFRFAVNPPSLMHYHGKDQKYLAAKLARPDGDVYVMLYTVAAYSIGGENKNRAFTQLDVIEAKAMQSNLVTVNADAIAREIANTGRIALYGIFFDSGKAEVRPESKPAIDEIGALLKRDTALKLLVVGHTDSAGDFDYNLDLSRRRAQAVVQALTGQYGIDAVRLKAWGVGYAAPVASNRSDNGRAKNRRVELVGQ